MSTFVKLGARFSNGVVTRPKYFNPNYVWKCLQSHRRSHHNLNTFELLNMHHTF